MASRPLGATIRRIERLFHFGSVAGMSEIQLLERFVRQHDDAAFEALVARHGPMVMGVCRQWLRDPSDVEDAFQATFLVLVRKAGSLRDRALLGNWLYGVAYRVALRARAEAARRRSREKGGVDDRADPQEPGSQERHPWLHEEVNRLPEKYRAPIVLCYLEGRTHEEAAEQLCWPVGTVKGRLSRARDLLRTRLSRRGLAPSAGLLTAALSRDASAAVPVTLIESTGQAASSLAVANGVAAGLVSGQVAALMEGVCRTMFLSKLKVITATLAVAGLLTASAGGIARQVSGEGDAGTEQEPAATGTSDPGKSAGPRDDARIRLELAQKALDSIAELRKQGHGDPGDEYLWSRRLLEAVAQVSDNKDDRVAAAKAHLSRMKNALDHVIIQEKAGLSPMINSLEVQFRYQEAAKGVRDAEAELGRGVARVDHTPDARVGQTSAPAKAPGAVLTERFASAVVSGDDVRPVAPVVFPPGMMRPPTPRTSPTPEVFVGAGAHVAASDEGGGLSPDVAAEKRRILLFIAQKARLVAARDSSPQTKVILKKLEDPISMGFGQESSLKDVLKYIKSATTGENDQGIAIYVDPRGLNDVDATLESTVSLDLEGVPLKTTLRLLLKQLGLAYCVRDGLLIISSPEGIHQELEEAESIQEEDRGTAQ
ncbi:sigma-70 family RNA polymerase sigma factor [Singulisphaera sp. Ch08]|uniref:Sigma-70 family RNA polymerase sigma factor n=1 Tax=Singulisphaera sp. Ch08 TaxID=3120278 RepID=A0AAU7CFZ5_9BACT